MEQRRYAAVMVRPELSWRGQRCRGRGFVEGPGVSLARDDCTCYEYVCGPVKHGSCKLHMNCTQIIKVSGIRTYMTCKLHMHCTQIIQVSGIRTHMTCTLHMNCMFQSNARVNILPGLQHNINLTKSHMWMSKEKH